MVRLFVFLIRLYRMTISPFLGPICRFHPSCSRYAEGCLLTHGFFLGSWLAVKRLGKCHPFHPGGVDPVPPKGFRNAAPYSSGQQ
jgi:putative membrane protein insertion efficiency factor